MRVWNVQRDRDLRHVHNATQRQIDARDGQWLCQTQCHFTGNTSATGLVFSSSENDIFSVWPYFEEFDAVAAPSRARMIAEELESHVGGGGSGSDRRCENETLVFWSGTELGYRFITVEV